MSVTIKVRDKEDLRRICIPKTTKFNGLQEIFKQLFRFDNFIVKYVDDEGDLITVTSDEELVEAFRLTKEGTILRMIISRDKDFKDFQTSKLTNSALFASAIEQPNSLTQSQIYQLGSSPPAKQIKIPSQTNMKPINNNTNYYPNLTGNIYTAPITNLSTSAINEAQNRIALDVSLISDKIAETNRQASAAISKKSEDLSKSIADSTIQLCDAIAASSGKISKASVNIGDDLCRLTVERSKELSEKTTTTVNKLAETTATSVDEASERMRKIIMGLKV